MTFQAYLDAIYQKSGKSAADFRELAGQRGYLDPGTKAGEIIAWLKADYDLGRGHAMAFVASFKAAAEPDGRDQDIRLAKLFAGPRAHWRPVFDRLMDDVRRFGPGVAAAATDSYISIMKGEKKFAVVAVTASRMDLGVKVADRAPTDRFEPAGTWNTMVSHRARIEDPAEIDGEIMAWLREAHATA